jgi:hypothetical protein
MSQPAALPEDQEPGSLVVVKQFKTLLNEACWRSEGDLAPSYSHQRFARALQSSLAVWKTWRRTGAELALTEAEYKLEVPAASADDRTACLLCSGVDTGDLPALCFRAPY